MSTVYAVITLKFRERNENESLVDYLSDAAVFIETRLSHSLDRGAYDVTTAADATTYESINDMRVDAAAGAGAFDEEDA